VGGKKIAFIISRRAKWDGTSSLAICASLPFPCSNVTDAFTFFRRMSPKQICQKFSKSSVILFFGEGYPPDYSVAPQ
jgi:hypothetical protein